MAFCNIAAFHASDLKRNDFIVQKRDDPADRTNETGSSGLPIHRLRPLQSEDRSGKRFGQQFANRASGDILGELPVIAGLGHRRKIDALFLGESRGSFFAGGERRAFDDLRLICRPFRQSRGPNHEPARRGVDLRGRAEEIELLQLRDRSWDHPVWNFLGADFKKEAETGTHAASFVVPAGFC